MGYKKFVSEVSSSINTKITTLSQNLSIRIPLGYEQNSTWSTYVSFPGNIIINNIKIITPIAYIGTPVVPPGFPVTPAHIYLQVKKGTSSGNSILNSSQINLETISINTVSTLSLTNNLEYKKLISSDLLYIAIISDGQNGSVPGDNKACVLIEYQPLNIN